MQLLKQHWHSYQAYRELYGRWSDFLSQSIAKDVDQYEKKLILFLECFITIAQDQIISNQTVHSQWQAAKELTLDEIVMNCEIAEPLQLQKVFYDIPKVVRSIFDYLNHRSQVHNQFLSSQSHLRSQSLFLRPCLPLTPQQSHLFTNCIDAMKMILKDYDDIYEFEQLEEFVEIIVGQFRIISDTKSAKSLVTLLEYLFKDGQFDQEEVEKGHLFDGQDPSQEAQSPSQEEQYDTVKTVFLKKYGFHEVLRQLIVGDREFKHIVCSFIKRNMLVMDPKKPMNTANILDDSEDDIKTNDDQYSRSPFNKYRNYYMVPQIQKDAIADFLYQNEGNQSQRMLEEQTTADASRARLANYRKLQASNQKQKKDNKGNLDLIMLEKSEEQFNQGVPSRQTLNKLNEHLEGMLNQGYGRSRHPSHQYVSAEARQTLKLHQILRDLNLYGEFNNLIGQTNLETLLHYISLLKFLARQDGKNHDQILNAGIYHQINNSFKRLIKYEQQQEIKQEVVIKSLKSLLIMSMEPSSHSLSHCEPLLCALTCIKVLLKQKTNNNYTSLLRELNMTVRQSAPLSCLFISQKQCTQLIKQWIETLIIDSQPEASGTQIASEQTESQLQRSFIYLQEILELCGIVCYNIGDLDQMCFANEVMDLIIQNDHNSQFNLQKRNMLIQFVCQHVDDKNLRLELKQPQVSFLFNDMEQVAQKTLQLFKTNIKIIQKNGKDCISIRDFDFDKFQQNTHLLLKLCKYQSDHMARTFLKHMPSAGSSTAPPGHHYLGADVPSIFGVEFDAEHFINTYLHLEFAGEDVESRQLEEVLEEYRVLTVLLCSSLMASAQLQDPPKMARIFEKNLPKIPRKFKQIFTLMVLSERHNRFSMQLKQHLNSGKILLHRNIWSSFMVNLQSQKLTEALQDLHCFILITQGQPECIEEVECNLIDFDELISELLKANITQEQYSKSEAVANQQTLHPQQLFLLRCLLELSSDQRANQSQQRQSDGHHFSSSNYHNIYGGALENCFKFMKHAIDRDETANIFDRAVQQNQLNDSFICNFADPRYIKAIEFEKKVLPRLNRLALFNLEDDLNKNGLLRDTNFLNAYFIVLFNSSVVNQVSSLYELNYILKMDTSNRRTLVELRYHEFVMGIVDKLSTNYTILCTSLNKEYSHQLLDLALQLIGYGEVAESQTQAPVFTMITKMIMLYGQQSSQSRRTGSKASSTGAAFVNSLKYLQNARTSLKHRQLAAETSNHGQINLAYEFTKKLIAVLGERSTNWLVQYDHLELKFNPEIEHVTLSFRLEGSSLCFLEDEMRKMMAIKINEKNQVSFWMDHRKIIIKRNDYNFKQADIEDLHLSHELLIDQYNSYEVRLENDLLSINLNGKRLCSIGHKLSSTTSQVQASGVQQDSSSKKRSSQVDKRTSFFLQRSDPSKPPEYTLKLYSRCAVDLENSFIRSTESKDQEKIDLAARLGLAASQKSTRLIQAKRLSFFEEKAEGAANGPRADRASQAQHPSVSEDQNSCSASSMQQWRDSEVSHEIGGGDDQKSQTSSKRQQKGSNYSLSIESQDDQDAYPHEIRLPFRLKYRSMMRSATRGREAAGGGRTREVQIVEEGQVQSYMVNQTAFQPLTNSLQSPTFRQPRRNQSIHSERSLAELGPGQQNQSNESTFQLQDLSFSQSSHLMPTTGVQDLQATAAPTMIRNKSLFAENNSQNRKLESTNTMHFGQTQMQMESKFRSYYDLNQLPGKRAIKQNMTILNLARKATLSRHYQTRQDTGAAIVKVICQQIDAEEAQPSPVDWNRNPVANEGHAEGIKVQTLKFSIGQNKRRAKKMLSVLLKLLKYTHDQELSEGEEARLIDDEWSKFSLSMRLFASFMINNEALNKLLVEINGIKIVENILKKKLLQKQGLSISSMDHIFQCLFNMFCNDHHAAFKIFEIQDMHERKQLLMSSDSTVADDGKHQGARSQGQYGVMMVPPSATQVMRKLTALDSLTCRPPFFELSLSLFTLPTIDYETIEMFLELLITLVDGQEEQNGVGEQNMNIFRQKVGMKRAVLIGVFKNLIIDHDKKMSMQIYHVCLRVLHTFIQSIESKYLSLKKQLLALQSRGAENQFSPWEDANSDDSTQEREETTQKDIKVIQGEFQDVLDFLIDINKQAEGEAAQIDPQYKNKRRNKREDMITRITIDTLTIIFTHILLRKNRFTPNRPSGGRGQRSRQPEPGQSLPAAQKMSRYEFRVPSGDGQRENVVPINPLLELLLQSDLFTIITQFINSGNLPIREHSIKLLQVVFFVYPEFYQEFKSKQGFISISKAGGDDLMSDERQRNSSYSLCQTVLNCMTQQYDNVYDFQRSSHLIVLQVLNKSKIAQEIMAQTNVAMKRKRSDQIIFFDFLDCFLQCVQQLEYESHERSRCQSIKELSHLFTNQGQAASPEGTNMQAILDTHFRHVIVSLFEYVQNNVRASGCDPQNLLQNLIYDFCGQAHHEFEDFMLLTADTDFDPNDEGDFIGFREVQSGAQSATTSFYPKQRDYVADLVEKQHDMRMQQYGYDLVVPIDAGKRAIKSISMVIEIIVTIIRKDLQRKPDQMQTLKLLKELKESEAASADPEGQASVFARHLFPYLILFGLLNKFILNARIQKDAQDRYVIENLNTILKSTKSLVPAHPMLVLKSVKLINSLAFKNTMEVRRYMKALEMFEVRDGLIIEYLQMVGILLVDTIKSIDGEDGHEDEQTKDKPSSSSVQINRLLFAICDFSFNVVATKQVFRDRLSIEILVLALLHSMTSSSPAKPEQDVSASLPLLSLRLLTTITDEVLQYSDNQAQLKRTMPKVSALFFDPKASESIEERLLALTNKEDLRELFSGSDGILPLLHKAFEANKAA